MGNPKKFLTAYGAVTGVGAAVLGYLAMSSASARTEAESDYDQKLAKVTALQKAKVFPNQAGVDAKATQVKSMDAAVSTLVSAIQAFQIADDPSATNATVQAKLNKYISDATANPSSDFVLPENFDLGFTRFRQTLPAEIAQRVDVWVEGANAVLGMLRTCNVSEIVSMQAPEVPWEKAAPAGAASGPPKPGTPPVKPKPGSSSSKQPASSSAMDEGKILERYPLQITFTGKTNSVTAAVQALSNSGAEAPGKFFYAVRNLRIESANKLGPEKDKEVRIEEKKDGDRDYKVDAVFVLGGENIRAYVDLDIVRVLNPAQEASATKTKN